MEETHTWEIIRDFDTTRENIHESCYRSYQILEQVKMMLKRGDSKETIMQFIEYCEL